MFKTSTMYSGCNVLDVTYMYNGYESCDKLGSKVNDDVRSEAMKL